MAADEAERRKIEDMYGQHGRDYIIELVGEARRFVALVMVGET